MAVLVMALASAWLGLGAGPDGAAPAQAAGTAARQAPPGPPAVQWWLRQLGAVQAWRSTEGAGVLVAVLADGIPASPAWAPGAVVTGPDLTRSGRRPGQQFYGVQGSEAASLITGQAGAGRVARRLAGIAPQARILSVRVTVTSGDPLLASPAARAALPGAIAAGITYAVRHGATVIDLPLDPGQAPGATNPGRVTTPGVTPPPVPVTAPDGSAAERAAVRYALRQGVTLVAPAGDNALGTGLVNYPAAYPGVLAAGAASRAGARAPSSSTLRYVRLTAPGAGVTAAVPAAASPSGYATVTSTTAASALVAGVAALVKAQFPTLTPAQVEAALTGSAGQVPPGRRAPGLGAGTVNAARALGLAAKLAGPVPRAGAGARPRVSPSPPAVPTARQVLTPRIRRYAVLSAGLLVILLLLVAAFALARWWRRRRAARADRAAGADRFVYGVSTQSAGTGPRELTAAAPGGSGGLRPAGTGTLARPRIVPAGRRAASGAGAAARPAGPGSYRGGTGGLAADRATGPGSYLSGTGGPAADRATAPGSYLSGTGGLAADRATAPGSYRNETGGIATGRSGRPGSAHGGTSGRGRARKTGRAGRAGRTGGASDLGGGAGPGGAGLGSSGLGSSGLSGAGLGGADLGGAGLGSGNLGDDSGGEYDARYGADSPAGGLVGVPRPAARAPRVTGSPPWGPAPKPEGEISWAASAASLPQPSGGYANPWSSSAAGPRALESAGTGQSPAGNPAGREAGALAGSGAGRIRAALEPAGSPGTGPADEELDVTPRWLPAPAPPGDRGDPPAVPRDPG